MRLFEGFSNIVQQEYVLKMKCTFSLFLFLIGYAEVMSRQFHVRRTDGQKHHRGIESGSRQSPARSIRDLALQKEP